MRRCNGNEANLESKLATDMSCCSREVDRAYLLSGSFVLYQIDEILM